MSLAASSWVFEHSPHKGAMLSLHQALADGAQDDGGNCLATLGTLGWKARLARGHTQRCLRKLEALGDITIHRGAGPNGLNIYHLTFANARPPRSGSGEGEDDESAARGGVQCANEAPVGARMRPPGKAIQLQNRPRNTVPLSLLIHIV